MEVFIILPRKVRKKFKFIFSGEWKSWSESGWPIATALSHGSRVMIQTPTSKSKDSNERDHSFWNWLITGSQTGDISKFISTSISGDEAEKNGQFIFKRLGATHSIDYKDGNKLDKINEDTVKYIYETKTSGLNFRDTKVLQGSDYTFVFEWFNELDYITIDIGVVIFQLEVMEDLLLLVKRFHPMGSMVIYIFITCLLLQREMEEFYWV
jgi:hypothetical protein